MAPSCDPAEWVVYNPNPEAAKYLLEQSGTVTAGGDCVPDYTVDSHTIEIENDNCKIVYLQTFIIHNNCTGNDDDIVERTVTVYKTDLPEYAIASAFFLVCDETDSNIKPNDNPTEIKSYLESKGIHTPSCWQGPVTYSMVNLGKPQKDPDNPERNKRYYDRVFVMKNTGCSENHIYITQKVILKYNQGSISISNPFLNETFTYGCSEADLPPACESLDEFAYFGSDVSISCAKDDMFQMTHEDTYQEKDGDGNDVYLRTYILSVDDKCDSHLQQTIKMGKNLWVDGKMEVQYYDADKEEPDPPVDVSRGYLESHGIKIGTTCDTELEIEWEEDEPVKYGNTDEVAYYKRKFSITDVENPSMAPQHVTETWKKKPGEATAFTFEYHDCTDYGVADGQFIVNLPSKDQGCKDCENIEDSYRVKLIWKDNFGNAPEKLWYPDEAHENPFMIEDLMGGEYEFFVYPQCPSEGIMFNENNYVFHDKFKIVEGKPVFYIQPDIAFSGFNLYCLMRGIHWTFDEKTETFRDVLKDQNSQWQYTWEHDKHYMCNFVERCDETKAQGAPEWSINERVDFWYSSMNRVYLRDVAMLKFLRRGSIMRANVRFSAKAETHNGHEVELEYERPVYYGFYNDSYDPNMISGPVGYGDDSIIAAKDRIDYRISFENSPDFATAAASRVVIKCPLHEKADSKTLRLGQFGFGDFIYDVPELSSHYNNRIDLADTLGVWLDVTAGLDIDNNEAYWIFQSIDPETGVQPNDTIGFLPVNDTLTGCGEGFVTFSIATFDDTKTGDTITEMAKIVFDENDTIPTNTCTNMFDAVAPTSILYGDTIGVSSSYYLNFKAVAQDDDGGSGIENVELFVSADKTEYVSAGFMTRDSVSDTLRMSYRLGFSTLYQFLCVAIDNVGNREAFKELPEYEYVNNNPPTDIFLSNRYFDEDAKIGDNIGTITTMDDQDSNEFEYTLVEGEGDDDNDKFSVLNDKLRVNYNFRCKDNDTYKVRIQSKDVNGDSLQKWFYIYANDVLTPEVTVINKKLCFGETVMFGGELFSDGVHYDTLQTVDGCDSVVKLNIIHLPDPVITYFDYPNCEGEDFAFEDFVIPWDSIENNFISSWDRHSDTTLIFKMDVKNADKCSDTLWLNMLLHPKKYDSHDVIICENGLPFSYGDSLFSEGGTKQVHFTSVDGCDSIVTVNLTVEPTYYNIEKFDTICDNEEYVIFSDTITEPGIHFVVGKTDVHHCDSVVMLRLTTLPTFSTVYNFDVCSSHLPMYDYEGFDIPADAMTGEMTRYETAQNGCDSIIRLNLTVREADTQENDFEGGWYWYSTYLDLNEINGLQALEDSLGEKGTQIKSQTQFVSYTDGMGWMGNLGSITNEEMYMIQTNDTVNVDLFSCLTIGSQHPITIHPNWNWIGYVSRYANSTENALGTLTPQDGDIIKSYDQGFAVYYEMLGGWFGSLTQMQPGIGYMYYSNNETDVTLIYPNPAKDSGRQLKMPPTHWNASVGKYPTNMTFIGKITIDNIPTTTDNLEVGVFCDGEVRGSGRAILMEGLGTYRLFVQVYGNNGDELTFKLYDHRTGREHDAKSYQKVYFADNTNYGSIKDPYPFKFYTKYTEPDNADVTAENVEDGGNMVGEEYNSHELTLVPNPANSSTRVLLYCDFTPEERAGLVVEVFNALGVRIQQIEPTRYPVQLKEIEYAGSYMVKVTTGTGRVLAKKLVTTR